MINMERNKELAKEYFSFKSFESIPLAFDIGDQVISGLGEDFSPYIQERRKDFTCGRKITSFVGVNEKNLELKALFTEYEDSSCVEWQFFITNKGTENTPVLSNIRTQINNIKGSNPVLIHGNGDTCGEDGYEFFKDKIENELKLSPSGGTSCCGCFPYMRVIFDEFSINCAIGWTGNWEADFVYNGESLSIISKQQRTHSYLKPGETWRLPSLVLMPYYGDEKIGRNLWRRWYIKYILPKENGKRLSPKLCLHTWMIDGKEEFCGANEKNQLTAIDTYIKNGLKPDIWWIDAGWYPCDGHWYQIGNWYPNPENWPNGMGALGEKCDENEIKLLLWFEPERVYENTDLWNNHPEWILHEENPLNPTVCGLVNLGDSACCEYMLNTIDSIIKNSGVKIYRQDFNYTPINVWITNEAPDRIGAIENAHIQGYYYLWDNLLERNPGLIIDSCASGGRRNDIETMKRAVPLHYTDVGYGKHPVKQKQHREMFEWIPYFRAHTMNWDDNDGNYTPGASKPVDEFSYYVAMAPSITSMTEYYHDEKAFALSRKMVAIWRKAAEMMLDGDYYPLSECKKSNEDFYAMQFDVEEKNVGFINVVRNTKAVDDDFVIFPEVRENATYHFENGDGSGSFSKTSDELKNGLTIKINKRQGVVLFYEIEA